MQHPGQAVLQGNIATLFFGRRGRTGSIRYPCLSLLSPESPLIPLLNDRLTGRLEALDLILVVGHLSGQRRKVIQFWRGTWPPGSRPAFTCARKSRSLRLVGCCESGSIDNVVAIGRIAGCIEIHHHPWRQIEPSGFAAATAADKQRIVDARWKVPGRYMRYHCRNHLSSNPG